MIILRITIREIARFWHLLRNIRRYGLVRAWRFYLLVHKTFPYGTVIRIEEEA